ncbi:MAG TPA: hypothetical protein VFI31_03215 [Pirellulales bacterium]|nr:hypothetical protein [Pirellulales bacterium]
MRGCSTIFTSILTPDFYVPAPLEKSYQATWAAFPAALKGLLEGPRDRGTADEDG